MISRRSILTALMAAPLALAGHSPYIPGDILTGCPDRPGALYLTQCPQNYVEWERLFEYIPEGQRINLTVADYTRTVEKFIPIGQRFTVARKGMYFHGRYLTTEPLA